ncbi:MAG TPA: hypothetical protein VIX13_03615 [Candidatus Eisenbacteria bacterium]
MFRRSAPRSYLAAAVLAATATLLFATAPAFSQGTPVTAAGSRVGAKETSLQRIQKMVARINAEASTPEGEQAVLDRLSKQLSASPDSLRAQHSAWGLGYGEVAMAYGFARASKKPGVTPEQVVEMRKGGMAWDAIGKELGVRVDTVAAKMRRHVGSKAAPRSK